MADPLLLAPPATGTTATSDAAGRTRPPSEAGRRFDPKGHTDRLRSTPKQPFKEPEPPPKAEGAAPGAGGPEPGTGGPEPGGPAPEGGGGPEPEQKHRDTAKTVFDMYDTITSKVCEGIVGDPKRYPADHFRMDTHTRSQAEHQLARGIAEGGGKFSMPWWAALALLMAFQGFLTWQSVKKAKQEREEREAKEQRRAAEDNERANNRRDPAPTGPVVPDSITDRDGTVIPMRREPTAAPPPSPSRATPPPSAMPPCKVCGAPVKHKNRQYCGQSCAGKATRGRKVAPSTNAAA